MITGLTGLKTDAERREQRLKRVQRKDVSGERVSVGDVVRVIGVPDLSGMSPESRAESLPVFEHLVGRYKRVEEFDEFGMAWLRFKIRKGPHAGYHMVGIEPYLLRVRRSTSFIKKRIASG
jgi:hypothetical protein